MLFVWLCSKGNPREREREREKVATIVDVTGRLFKSTALVVNLQMLQLNFAKKKSQAKVVGLCMLGYKFCRYCGEMLSVH